VDSPPENTPGIRPALKQLCRTVAAIAGNRLELLAVEAEEARLQSIGLLLWLAAALAFGVMTLGSVTLLILVLCWENHREAALICCSAIYLVITIVSVWQFNEKLRHWRAFSATLEEIKKDLKCLDEKS
jgi:uncharacterized membrane protein YqjE